MVGKDGRVKLQGVHIDMDFGTTVAVDVGLKEGDKVIDNPSDALRAGDLVKIADRNGV